MELCDMPGLNSPQSLDAPTGEMADGRSHSITTPALSAEKKTNPSKGRNGHLGPHAGLSGDSLREEMLIS